MNGQRRLRIGLLTPYTGGFYYGAILAGIQKAAQARGTHVIALQSGGMDLVWPGQTQALPLAMQSVDGWIVANDHRASELVKQVLASGKPLITLSQRAEGRHSCSVLPDNHAGARQSVQHLLEHGHRRIAFAGCLAQVDIQERYQGYLSALREAEIPADPALQFDCANNLELDGRDVAHRLLRAGLPCTALVAGADKTALGILAALSELGHRVPQDLALLGFDDVEKAQYVDPPLSTVRQRFDLLGSVAANVLIEHLSVGSTLPDEVRVPTLMVVRRSCGCGALLGVPSRPSSAPRVFEPETLLERLLQVAESRHLAAVAPGNWPGAKRIVNHLESVLDGRPSEQDGSEVWAGFLEISRDVESVEAVIHVMEAWVRQHAAEGVPVATIDALFASVRHLRLGLLRSWRIFEQDRNWYYDFVAEANGRINQALTGTGFAAAKNLQWLQWTRIRYGCLGLWDERVEGPPQVKVVGEYGQDGTWGTLLDTCHAPQNFPPPVTADLIEQLGLENVLILVPIQGVRHSRGLLMLAGPVEVEFADHHGSVGDWAALVATSLEREEMERQLRENAFRDTLTGLPNRALLLDRLEQVMATARRGRQSFAVLFLDLDDFKNINDSLGHIAGDQLIVQVASRLQDTLRDTDTLGRLGGDEFALIVPNIRDKSQVLEIAAQVQEALRPPCSVNGNAVFTSCSIGIALSSDRHQHAEELLREADTAMYRAKLEGRARHEVFDSGMHAQAVERLRLDSRLRQALDRGEFALHFQPVFSMTTGLPVGAEALIRWNHPEQGCLSPGRFLAVAEEVGLAIPISRWVIDAACREAKVWQRSGEPVKYVNINLPAQHLKDPSLVASVRAVLHKYDLPPAALGLELVESSLIDTRKSSVGALRELRAMGVRTAIDDFGTGYSALSYLKRFPINVLKIDRSFVSGVPSDVYDSAIAAAIIAMAHDLQLSVIAEGVETREQLQFLRAHDCDAVQGFLLSRPLPAHECREALLGATKSDALLEYSA